MKNTKLKVVLSTFVLFSMLSLTTFANAAPLLFLQAGQVGFTKPTKAAAGCSRQKCLIDNDLLAPLDDAKEIDDVKEKVKPTPTPQDGRVITETRTEIVEETACDCEEEKVVAGGFPIFPLFGLPFAFLPFLFVRGGDTIPPNPDAVSPMRR